MITKFERKVIAGLTAFLMCLSMIFAVPVSVNAEAERTQDEAVSGVQQNETVKDVQIPDGMSENVPVSYSCGSIQIYRSSLFPPSRMQELQHTVPKPE